MRQMRITKQRRPADARWRWAADRHRGAYSDLASDRVVQERYPVVRRRCLAAPPGELSL
jgi:hypothetical protein